MGFLSRADDGVGWDEGSSGKSLNSIVPNLHRQCVAAHAMVRFFPAKSLTFANRAAAKAADHAS